MLWCWYAVRQSWKTKGTVLLGLLGIPDVVMLRVTLHIEALLPSWGGSRDRDYFLPLSPWESFSWNACYRLTASQPLVSLVSGFGFVCKPDRFDTLIVTKEDKVVRWHVLRLQAWVSVSCICTTGRAADSSSCGLLSSCYSYVLSEPRHWWMGLSVDDHLSPLIFFLSQYSVGISVANSSKNHIFV